MDTGAKTAAGIVSANASTTAGLASDHSTGTVYLTSTGNDSLFTLDLTTGTATLVGAYGDAALVMHGLEWDDSTGTLYGSSSHNDGLYRINTANQTPFNYFCLVYCVVNFVLCRHGGGKIYYVRRRPPNSWTCWHYCRP